MNEILHNPEALDNEFKRYLQILRPNVSQLVDQDVIDICNAWIQKLSNVTGNNEKLIRNKYVFNLCYQIAKGILEEPFCTNPPDGPLTPIPEIDESDASSEVEYVVSYEKTDQPQELFDSKQAIASETVLTHFLDRETDFDELFTATSKETTSRCSEGNISPKNTHKQSVICYTCPELMKKCAEDINGDNKYEFRANNLIKRLRQIKKENMLLHNEILELKEESKIPDDLVLQKYVNTSLTIEPALRTSSYHSKTATNISCSRPVKTQLQKNQGDMNECFLKFEKAMLANESEKSETPVSVLKLRHMKNQLEEVKEENKHLITTIAKLQDDLDNFEEIKRMEIEDIIAKHKLDIIKIKSSCRAESRDIYDEKIGDLKEHYDNLISNIKADHATEIQVLQMNLGEKEKSLNEIILQKIKEITEKDQLLATKEDEINTLKAKLEEQKHQLESALNRLSDKTNDEVNDTIKSKAQELEKRLLKLEKTKLKCAKAYEGKLLYLQREKHLAECSLQMQLVRQRAQVVKEVTEEHNSELQATIEKLESKYKDIVANVQTTAIQRRLQDQMALEAILQAAFKSKPEAFSNQSQISGKTVTLRQPKDPNISYESELSAIRRTFGEDHTVHSFCLEGDRLGELFEKVYIPQRDRNDGPLKKA